LAVILSDLDVSLAVMVLLQNLASQLLTANLANLHELFNRGLSGLKKSTNLRNLSLLCARGASPPEADKSLRLKIPKELISNPVPAV